MKKQLNKIGLCTALVAFTLSGSAAFALSGPGDSKVHTEDGSSTTTTSSTADSSTSTSTDKTDSGKPTGDGEKLTDVHLRLCKNRQETINHILNRIVERGTNQMNLFSGIAERVETFKTNKNLTVANYDQLVAAIQADQTKVTSDLAAMKANDTLACTGDNPHGVVDTFKTDLQTEINDLKIYKTDVKNLIVAVKTAAGTSTDAHTGDSSKSSTTTGGAQ